MGRSSHLEPTRSRMEEKIPSGGRAANRLTPTKTESIAVGSDMTSPVMAYNAVARNKWPKAALDPKLSEIAASTVPALQFQPLGAIMQRHEMPRQIKTRAVLVAMTAARCAGKGSPSHKECPVKLATIRNTPTVVANTAQAVASRCCHGRRQGEMKAATESGTKLAAVWGWMGTVPGIILCRKSTFHHQPIRISNE